MKVQELAEQISQIPFENAVVVGSACLWAYSNFYHTPLPQNYSPGDIDLSVPQADYESLKTMVWRENNYRGVKTLRGTNNSDDTIFRYDVGVGAHIWNYEDVASQALSFDDQLFMNPGMLTVWKLSQNRLKDQPHLNYLNDIILPAAGFYHKVGAEEVNQKTPIYEKLLGFSFIRG